MFQFEDVREKEALTLERCLGKDNTIVRSEISGYRGLECSAKIMAMCPKSNSQCVQKYSAKEYFLALFIVIAFVLVLRLLLYVVYRACHRVADPSVPRMDRNSAGSRDYLSTQSMPIRMVQGSTNCDGESMCVILPGEDRPRFIAQPAPLSGFRDSIKKGLNPVAAEEGRSAGVSGLKKEFTHIWNQT
eukprot:Gb_29545 [translate_table: standard]